MVHKHELHELTMARILNKASALFEFIDFCLLGMLANINFSGITLTLQETRSTYDSMNRPKIEFIAYIYILL